MSNISKNQNLKKELLKRLNQNIQSLLYYIKKTNNKYNFNEITDKVKVIDNSIKYNTSLNIEYQGKIFAITAKNYYDSLEATLRCEFYRRTKDLEEDETRFCEAAIKGFKNVLQKNIIFI